MEFLKKLKSIFAGSRYLDIASRFSIEKEAIHGTMSEFFIVREHKSGQMMGLKILDLEKQKFFASRFEGRKRPFEGEIAQQMDHPNVVKTFEHGLLRSGQQYILMEYIPGLGLNSIIREKNSMIEGQQLNLIKQMVESVKYVHEAGFMHRDICPRNFIVSKDGQLIKLIDFGLSLPAEKEFMIPGNRTGTPNYMAPEIVRRKATDQRSDLFSLGVTFFRLCTYQLPWPSSEGSGLAALNHDSMAPRDIFEVRPTINKRLGEAIMDLMQQNPSNRPESADALRKILLPITKFEEN